MVNKREGRRERRENTQQKDMTEGENTKRRNNQHTNFATYLHEQLRSGGNHKPLCLHHKLRQLQRISSQWVKLQPFALNVVAKTRVRGETHAVPVPLQPQAQLHEGLHVTSVLW